MASKWRKYVNKIQKIRSKVAVLHFLIVFVTFLLLISWDLTIQTFSRFFSLISFQNSLVLFSYIFIVSKLLFYLCCPFLFAVYKTENTGGYKVRCQEQEKVISDYWSATLWIPRRGIICAITQWKSHFVHSWIIPTKK